MTFNREEAAKSLSAKLLASPQSAHGAIICDAIASAWNKQERPERIESIRAKKVLTKLGKRVIPCWSIVINGKSSWVFPFRDAQLGDGPGTQTAETWCETQSQVVMMEADAEHQLCWTKSSTESAGDNDDADAWDALSKLCSEQGPI